MSVDEAIDQYQDFGNDGFGHPRMIMYRWLTAKFSSDRAENALQTVVYNRLGPNNSKSEHDKTTYAQNLPFVTSDEHTRT